MCKDLVLNNSNIAREVPKVGEIWIDENDRKWIVRAIAVHDLENLVILCAPGSQKFKCASVTVKDFMGTIYNSELKSYIFRFIRIKTVD